MKETVLALGSFDGLHRAHMAIIEKTIEYAKDNDLASGALLFDRLPREALGHKIEHLMTIEDKKSKLSMLDFIHICEFTTEFSDMLPLEFGEFLKKEFNVKMVCAGYNYRFGKNASGDIKTLVSVGEKFGFSVIQVPEYTISGETVSSTRIREFIKEGNIKNANLFLGYDFFISGVVVDGYHLGRTMGVPTVNLKFDDKNILPKFGVYAGYVEADGEKYNAVINVGERPTFNRHGVTVESFLLDFNGNLYNKGIKVYFTDFLREEIKFENKQELSVQIKKDILLAQEIFKERQNK